MEPSASLRRFGSNISEAAGPQVHAGKGGGSGSTYDVLRSEDPTEWYGATCVSAGGAPTTALPDPEDPEPGEIFYYLVGAASECGLSTLGNDIGGSPRHGTACDPETSWWE